MNPNYVEDINGSDYVCMTGSNNSQSSPTVSTSSSGHYHQKMMSAPIQSSTSQSPSHNRQSAPVTATAESKSCPIQQPQTTAPISNNQTVTTNTISVQRTCTNSVSPTPSQMSGGSGSGKAKGLSKNLLPYNVTPPRPAGPTEAERKIEELTRQLEEEMEKNEEQGEYFGICHTCREKVTGAGQACQAMGNLYHTNCFICCSCGRALRGKAFYNVHGRVYCEEDYMVRVVYKL